MPDYGARYTDRAIAQTEKEIKKTYRRAQKELKEKLADFERKFAVKNQEKRKALQQGKISEQDYKNWLTGQVFIRNQWQSKIRQVSEIMHDCNRQAVNLINNKRLDVFAENYNYMAFRGEKATGISFGLYNSQAVARLMQENPKMLPEWKVDEEKDYQWNEQKVNNIVRQGIIQGESIPQIADRLCDELVSMNENKMNMFARTAMTEAQNAGRQQQMNDAADMGIDIHKQWLATLDSRTRDSHRKLDGQEVPYNEPFDSPLGEIEYPGDSDAEPANVFNCRCTMVSIYPKYEDRSKPDWREEETIDGMTYQEWKENKKAEEEEKPAAKETEETAKETEKSKIDLIKDKIKDHGDKEWTTDELIELGEAVDEAVTEETGEVDIDSLQKEYDRLYEETRQISTQLGELRRQIWQADTEKRYEDADKLGKQYKELEEQYDKKYEQRKKVYSEIEKAKNARGEALSRVLPKIREVGGVTKDNVDQYADLKYYERYQGKKTREKTIEALGYYPKKWLDESASFASKLRPHWTTGRAYYGWGEIRFKERLQTNIHELGHRFEHVIPAIKKAEKDFYERRTKGEQLQWLGRGYKRDEKTRFDKFVHAYMGKDYGGSAYELVSVGFQMAFTEYERLAKDPEMLHWILGILAGV